MIRPSHVSPGSFAAIAILGILAIVFAIHASTLAAMAELWKQTAYSHGYAVMPLFAWLVWERRATLAALAVRPSWLGANALVALGAVWIAAEFLATAGPAQFAVVAMVPAVTAALLGTAWVRALAFPLAFLFFAVPFGEAWVPTMMRWTADFTVAALRLSGVPVYREGTYFSIPSGDWSVAEACSGIAYMSACVMSAALFAWTLYRSMTRRLLFVAFAIVMALVANWLRAYAIVMLAHYSDYRLAVGVDHFVYGFVFFGVIVAVVFGLGLLWREDRHDEPGAGPAADVHTPAVVRPRGAVTPTRVAAAVVAIAALLWPVVSSRHAEAATAVASAPVDIAAQSGWTRVDAPVATWQPSIHHPSWTTVQTYAKDGRQVTLMLAGFDRSTADSKLVSAAHRLAAADDRQWRQVAAGSAQVARGGATLELASGTLNGPAGRLLVWHGYWVDGLLTDSGVRAIAAQFAARWQGRSAMSAWVGVVAVDGDGAEAAPPALQTFLADMLGAIDDGLRASSTVQSSRTAP